MCMCIDLYSFATMIIHMDFVLFILFETFICKSSDVFILPNLKNYLKFEKLLAIIPATVPSSSFFSPFLFFWNSFRCLLFLLCFLPQLLFYIFHLSLSVVHSGWFLYCFLTVYQPVFDQ